ncbi:MAG: hypothetical protein IIA60_12505 [Candidatus Marinimicrobia bacterium]|nr:hypothetical protein [Candidatus Neomarinimicrobiota bacterium]
MQKIINILVVVLLGVTLYYTIYVDYKRSRTMKELTTSGIELQGHKNMIDEEYRRLSLKFEGRGRHMQRMQVNIKDLGSRLIVITDSLGNKIEETNYLLSQVEELLREDIRRVEGDVRALSDEMTTYKRRTNRSILDMQDALSTLEDDLKALQEKVEPEEE